ncbi:MAG TPA: hypothetical protein RMG48_02740 [Myxococcales bacterium LLY-WYZ-16_1]|nr:hypothetical protein [Myxococcales bacterium LLY-WYZ-16_1]
MEVNTDCSAVNPFVEFGVVGDSVILLGEAEDELALCVWSRDREGSRAQTRRRFENVDTIFDFAVSENAVGLSAEQDGRGKVLLFNLQTMEDLAAADVVAEEIDLSDEHIVISASPTGVRYAALSSPSELITVDGPQPLLFDYGRAVAVDRNEFYFAG